MMVFRLILSISFILILSNSYALSEPVALWQFDDGKGDTVKDSSGHGNNGVITGKIDQAWVDGKKDKALFFDGGTAGVDNIMVPHSESLNIVDAITIMAWFQPDALGGAGLGGFRCILKKEAVYALYVIDHNPCLYLANPSEAWFNPLSTLTELQVGNWYHIAATYDGKNMRIYLDGVMEGESQWGDKIGSTDKPLIMGTNILNFQPHHNIGPLMGKLDEVAIYNEALSQEDIMNVMTNGFFAVEPKAKLATTWSNIKTINLENIPH
jgi:hypothetical protein